MPGPSTPPHARTPPPGAAARALGDTRALPRWRLGLVDPIPGGLAWLAQREADPLGYRIHLITGMACLIFITFPTSVMEFAALPLAIVTLVRAGRLWRTWGALALQIPMLGLIGWLGVMALSRLWTPDPGAWVEEAGVARFALLPLLLWPLLGDRDRLIGALKIGLLVGVGVQAAHLLGVTLGIEALDWGRKPGRVSGWWDPVVAGTLLTAALGLHLGPLLTATGSRRWVAGAGALATLLGVALTGTRGAWLACAGLLVLSGGVWLVVHLRRGARRGRTLAGIGASLVVLSAAGAGLWAVAGERLSERARAGVEEVRLALVEGRSNTDTGMRLLLNRWALEAFVAHPIRGVGAGGYRAWTASHAERTGLAPGDYTLHGHAHSAPLHLLATGGLLATIPALVFAAFTLLASFRPEPGAWARGVALGPALALSGLALVGVFDTVQVNQQTSALLFALVGLCPAWTPRRAAGAL